MKRLLFAVLVVVALSVVTVAAGRTSATTLRIKTDPVKLAFNKKALAATRGKVTIVMTNLSILKHNVALRASTTAKSKVLVKGKVVGKGGISKVTWTLKRGKYRYFCSVPGHEPAGMWGVLTVK